MTAVCCGGDVRLAVRLQVLTSFLVLLLVLSWLSGSDQDVSGAQLTAVQAVLEGTVLCNDSHLNNNDGVYTPNGAPTEVSLITGTASFQSESGPSTPGAWATIECMQ
jgi:hypothetical protein